MYFLSKAEAALPRQHFIQIRYKTLTLTVVTADGWTEDQRVECVELIPNYHPITMLMNSNHNTIDEVPFQLPDLVSLHLIPLLLDTECWSNSSWGEGRNTRLAHNTLYRLAGSLWKEIMAAAAWHIWGSGPFLWLQCCEPYESIPIDDDTLVIRYASSNNFLATDDIFHRFHWLIPG